MKAAPGTAFPAVMPACFRRLLSLIFKEQFVEEGSRNGLTTAEHILVYPSPPAPPLEVVFTPTRFSPGGEGELIWPCSEELVKVRARTKQPITVPVSRASFTGFGGVRSRALSSVGLPDFQRCVISKRRI